MSKKKLLTPVYTFLRRSLPSITTTSHAHFPVNSTLLETSQTLSPHKFCNHYLAKRELSFARQFCSAPTHTRCWNCNELTETTPFLVCNSCKTIQPVDHSVDYFQIFGLGREYKIEDGSLEGKYKNWQKKLHPDLVHSKSEKEREYAAEQSAKVIDAYRTLQKPLSRAMYVLKLEGENVDEEQTITDSALLGEILEIREAVEEAADSQALKDIQTQMQQNLKHWSESFAKAFQRHDFEEAKIAIQRMTYYERVNEEIVKKL